MLILINPFICPFFFFSNKIFRHRYLSSYESHVCTVCLHFLLVSFVGYILQSWASLPFYPQSLCLTALCAKIVHCNNNAYLGHQVTERMISLLHVTQESLIYLTPAGPGIRIKMSNLKHEFCYLFIHNCKISGFLPDMLGLCNSRIFFQDAWNGYVIHYETNIAEELTALWE